MTTRVTSIRSKNNNDKTKVLKRNLIKNVKGKEMIKHRLERIIKK